MGTEIERKFLVTDDSWRAAADGGESYLQGYLSVGPPAAIRVRVCGNTAILNLKMATGDLSRVEFEYPIPATDARAILRDMCVGHIIEKTRYRVLHAGLTWEIDVFGGVNAGLVVAELELESETQPFEKPAWAGEDISADLRYRNSNLCERPCTQWP